MDGMRFSNVLKGKLLVIALVSAAVVGSATALAATTSDGQHLIHAITSSTSAPTTPGGQHSAHAHATGADATATTTAGDHNNNCPGLSDAQNLATSFSLSTGSTSDDIQAICSLHQGAFKGTTPGDASLSSSRVFGYGEIDDLLIYAQYLAIHDKANASGKLTSDNTRSYLAEALQSCGTMPLETCLKTNIPGFQPGSSGSRGNGNGKPASTPTSGGGRPTATPTPHH